MAALVISASLLAVSSLHFEAASAAEWKPVQLWAADLPDTVTGACFQVNSAGDPVCYVCANGQLLALDAKGRRIPTFLGVEETVERLVALPAVQGELAFVGFENWGDHILFFDRDGNLVQKTRTPESTSDWLPSDEKQFSTIDWLAVQDSNLLVGFNGSDGLRMFEIKLAEQVVELIQMWGDMEVGNCWNVALGRFGGGFVAASSNAGGELFFYTADGAQRRSWQFDYFSPLGVLPLPDGTSILVAVNSFGDIEEAIGLRHDKVVFRKLIGTEGDAVTWRWQRIVSGRFLDGNSYQVAVLRGDGSVVLFDAAGHAVNLVAAEKTRIAVELGPPHNGRDTLLCAEKGKLRRFYFPAAMPRAAAEAAAEVKHPNEVLLAIAETDTSDDLWGRALFLTLFGGASDADILRSLTEAIARTKDKAPLYVSLADQGAGGTPIRRVLSHVLAALRRDFDLDASGTAQDERSLDIGLDQSTMTQLARMMVESFQKPAQMDPARQKIGELLATLQSKDDMPALLYLAAIAENPDYLTAWYRLTKFANEKLAGRAAAALIERDPNNAMAYYSQALHRLNSGDLAGALESIQLGNGKNICRSYPFPVPTEISFRFPRSEDLEHFGVAGKPASATGLAFIVENSANVVVFGNSLRKQLRNIGYELNEEGQRLDDAGKTERAIEYWETVRRMGFQLMKVQPRESLLVLTASGIASAPYDELKEAYQALRNKTALEGLEQTEAQRRRFGRVYRGILQQRKWVESDEAKVLLGERNLFEEEHDRITRALLAAGLIEDSNEDSDGQQDVERLPSDRNRGR